MALGRDSIATARKLIEEYKKDALELNNCFDDLETTRGGNAVYQTFTNETDVGKSLDYRLGVLISAMIKLAEQMQKVSEITDQFLTRQEYINSAK